MTGAGSPSLWVPEAGEPGVVIWITGLSGAGKSTIARATYRRLKRLLPNVVLLDGDAVRELMGDGLGHTPGDRLVNAHRLARLCRFLSEQGLHVVCATMSLFHACQAWNRQHLPRYFEVYVRVPLNALIARDRRGFYAEALRGARKNVVGIDLPFDEPRHPDLVIQNAEDRGDFSELLERIIQGSGVLGRLQCVSSGG